MIAIKIRNSIIIFQLFLLNISLGLAQNYHDYGFTKEYDILCQDSLSSTIKMPWAGGLNYCQFETIDLNFDGIDDLVVFDRSGNKIKTFLNEGTANQVSFQYSPDFETVFPDVSQRLQLRDFNNDGKKDLFTFYSQGIRVYKNISDPTTGIKFELVEPWLRSEHNGNQIPILAVDVDLPAIEDIDSDGDLDILVFWGLGSWVNYHKNMSVEWYGNADSLVFVREEQCWGYFMESESSNVLTLDTICNFKCDDPDRITSLKKDRHTGSTMLITDFNNDGLKDLVLGDVDYQNLIQLENGGTADSAYMISQDTLFPNPSQPVYLYSFPAVFFLDVNNDGKKDLLASPFNAIINNPVSENYHSIWYYENTGSNTTPTFSFTSAQFLISDMLDFGAGAVPVFFDYNSDGLLDIFISNFGYRDTSYYHNYFLYSEYSSAIALLENIGTQESPAFRMITRNFLELSGLEQQSLHPTFEDIDQDNDVDIVLGNKEGSLIFLENNSGQSNQWTFNAPVFDSWSIDVGDYSRPHFIDLDRDGLKDLVIGEKRGRLSYYRNTGSQNNPAFTFITDTLGGVNVTDQQTSNFGYSIPYFFEDSLGNYALFVGSESGNIHYYKNIEQNITGIFEHFDNNILALSEGIHSGAAVGDLNNDSYPDMVVGNYAGGLGIFTGCEPPDITGKKDEKQMKASFINIYPNPVTDILFISSKKEYSPVAARLTIYNIIGEAVFQSNFEGFLKIDVSDFEKGIYLIQISSTENKLLNSYATKIMIH